MHNNAQAVYKPLLVLARGPSPTKRMQGIRLASLSLLALRQATALQTKLQPVPCGFCRCLLRPGLVAFSPVSRLDQTIQDSQGPQIQS